MQLATTSFSHPFPWQGLFPDKRVSSCLTAHQHKIGYLVPYTVGQTTSMNGKRLVTVVWRTCYCDYCCGGCKTAKPCDSQQSDRWIHAWHVPPRLNTTTTHATAVVSCLSLNGNAFGECRLTSACGAHSGRQTDHDIESLSVTSSYPPPGMPLFVGSSK